jgi:hypothetical protein
MINIAVLDGIDYRCFIDYMKHIFDALDIEYNFLNTSILNYSTLDYIILNSSLEHKEMNLAAEYCFVNMDNKLSSNITLSGNMITYGFGGKNTVTVSSLDENNLEFVYCLQRYLSLNHGGVIEPQEIPLKLKFDSDTELYASMTAISIALIKGINISEIERKLNKKVLVLS